MRMRVHQMKWLSWLWRAIEQVIGGGAYEHYREHLRMRHPEAKMPSEREFYLSCLNERYSRPNRCC